MLPAGRFAAPTFVFVESRRRIAIHADVRVCRIEAADRWTLLLVGRSETDGMPVGVGDRDEKPNRTLAVGRRHVRDGDFIPDVQGIRSGLADAEPREGGDAAAGDRPLDDFALRVLDL